MNMVNPTIKPRPRWLPPISLVVVALLTGLLSFTPPGLRLSPFAVTGQACLLILTLRAFCYWPPMVCWVAAMPIPHRVIFGLVLGGMVLGHYTFDSRTYFPYVAWEIFPFANERDPVTCREFLATTASGQKVRLLTEQLFPSIVQIYALDDPAHFPPNQPEKLDHLAFTLAKAYNEQHPADPVRRVDLVVMAVHLHPPPNESRAEPSCQLLRHYDISSGR